MSPSEDQSPRAYSVLTLQDRFAHQASAAEARFSALSAVSKMTVHGSVEKEHMTLFATWSGARSHPVGPPFPRNWLDPAGATTVSVLYRAVSRPSSCACSTTGWGAFVNLDGQLPCSATQQRNAAQHSAAQSSKALLRDPVQRTTSDTHRNRTLNNDVQPDNLL